MKIIICLFFAMLFSVCGYAQSGTIAISGVVKFADGQLVDGANITLGNESNEWYAVSDYKGAYSFKDIPTGNYAIFVSGWINSRVGKYKKGFQILPNQTGPLVLDIELEETK